MGLMVCRVLLLHALFSAWCTAQQRTGDGRVILNLGYITSYSGDFVSSGSIPGAQLAVDRINNDSRILPGYYLQLQTGFDSRCNTDAAFDEYFRFWTSKNPNQTAPIFIGGGCSVATEPMLTAGRFWRTMQISYGSSAPLLSDSNRFPYHFGVLASEINTHKSQAIVVNQFGWDEVTVIVQNEELFVSDSNSVREFMQRDLGISTVNTFRFISLLPISGIDQALDDRPRVIIINAYQRFTREVLCQLYKRNRYYPFYQIIIPAWYDDDLWKETEVTEFNYTSECSLSDIRTVLNNVIATFNQIYPRDTSIAGLAGWSADTFTANYRAAVEASNDTAFAEYGLPAFDAVYVAALAMNTSVVRLRDLGLELEGFRFEDFNRSAVYADILREEVGKVELLGVTGPLLFDSSGERLGVPAAVLQYRVLPSGELTRVSIGETNFTSRMVEFNVTTEEIFPSGIPTEEIISVNVALFSVMSALAILGVAFSVVCLLFNLIFMKKKYIKLTSPLINAIICVGAILLYVTMVLLGVPTTNMAVQSALCNASIWVPALGFTLLFGSLIVKTWRIYYIFRQVNSQKFGRKARLKPWMYSWLMLMAIGVMVAVDLVFFVIVTSIDLTRFYATEHSTSLSRSVILVCTSNGYDIVIAVFLIYKALYLCVGLFLAFETRKVNVEAINDARFIGLAVYCCVLTCIPLVPIGILLREQQEARYGVLAGGIFFATTVILCVLFLPKMIGMYRRRNDNTADAALAGGLGPQPEQSRIPLGTITASYAPTVELTAIPEEDNAQKKQVYKPHTLSTTNHLVVPNGHAGSTNHGVERSTKL